jgi:ribose transport system substrate-binding protein
MKRRYLTGMPSVAGVLAIAASLVGTAAASDVAAAAAPGASVGTGTTAQLQPGTSGTACPMSSSPVKGYTAGLPSSSAALYKDSYDILGPSVYRGCRPEKPPWTICFNNSYLGNTWRAATLEEFNALVAQYRHAGLVSKSYATNSDLNLPTQITQMLDMVHVDHCSGIITIPTGTAGMDRVIAEAAQAGIPVVDDLGPTTTPYAENFDENFVTSGIAEAEFLAKAMHGHGNLLDVIGIPGETIDLEYQLALQTVLKKYPGIHIIGKPVGKVTDTIAQSAVLSFLATHPQPIQGVYQEGGMGAGIIAAFEQEKRPVPALVFVGSGSMISIFHNLLKAGKHPDFYALTDPPKFCMKESFDILIRILEGQHPKNMTIFYPPPAITASNVNAWWSPSLTPSSTAWPEPPFNAFPDSVLNGYFTNGRAPLPYEGKG